MSDLFWLADEQIERLRPFFTKATVSRVSTIAGC
ncbi:hypothetical protein SPMU_32290 [Sphingomonas mucosissima]|uniref:Uncharacterized protein n=1 Tax=Sphingomonas mucosissima TaxID=370959 RepID=A0A245ZE18_9SPHN|nr:hypothetical protein SPMU_32290 [Sphingomonas mucosissima]